MKEQAVDTGALYMGSRCAYRHLEIVSKSCWFCPRKQTDDPYLRFEIVYMSGEAVLQPPIGRI